MASELSMRGGELGEPLVLTPLRTNSAVTAYWRGDSDLTVAASEASALKIPAGLRTYRASTQLASPTSRSGFDNAHQVWRHTGGAQSMDTDLAVAAGCL